MKYEALGELCVIVGGKRISLNSPKLSALLATLLIRADTVVPTSSLAAEIWSEESSSHTSAGIYVSISRLRKILRQPGKNAGPILTRPPGYLLQVDTDNVDYLEFDRRVKDGRTRLRERDHAGASATLRDALRLWRGSCALGGLSGGTIISGFAKRIEEQRMECLELAVEADLALGRHRELISELYSLVIEHPLQERFHQQLMLALYRSHRQADALNVYERARSRINEELGLEPRTELSKLYRLILVADSRLDLR